MECPVKGSNLQGLTVLLGLGSGFAGSCIHHSGVSHEVPISALHI